MAKIKRREIPLTTENKEMIKSLMKEFNISTESKALIRALIIATKVYPALLYEITKLEENILKLQNEYDIIHRNSVNFLCSAKIMHEHLKSDIKIK